MLGPAIARALTRRGIAHETGTFDLLYPGYGDSATTLLYGAAGMTLEAGDQVPFARRVVAHETAALAVVRAVAAHRAALVRRWPLAFTRPIGATTGWALGPGSEDTVAALLAQGVRVGRLAAPAHVDSLRPWSGGAAAAADLPAGTWLVSARQPLARWLRTALARPAGAGTAAPSDDVRAWSLGQFAAGGGGTLASALPRAPGVGAPGAPARPLAGRRVALLADPGARSTARAGLEQPSAGHGVGAMGADPAARRRRRRARRRRPDGRRARGARHARGRRRVGRAARRRRARRRARLGAGRRHARRLARARPRGRPRRGPHARRRSPRPRWARASGARRWRSPAPAPRPRRWLEDDAAVAGATPVARYAGRLGRGDRRPRRRRARAAARLRSRVPGGERRAPTALLSRLLLASGGAR